MKGNPPILEEVGSDTGESAAFPETQGRESKWSESEA